jgi:hypothetical protein
MRSAFLTPISINSGNFLLVIAVIFPLLSLGQADINAKISRLTVISTAVPTDHASTNLYVDSNSNFEEIEQTSLGTFNQLNNLLKDYGQFRSKDAQFLTMQKNVGFYNTLMESDYVIAPGLQDEKGQKKMTKWDCIEGLTRYVIYRKNGVHRIMNYKYDGIEDMPIDTDCDEDITKAVEKGHIKFDKQTTIERFTKVNNTYFQHLEGKSLSLSKAEAFIQDHVQFLTGDFVYIGDINNNQRDGNGILIDKNNKFRVIAKWDNGVVNQYDLKILWQQQNLPINIQSSDASKVFSVTENKRLTVGDNIETKSTGKRKVVTYEGHGMHEEFSNGKVIKTRIFYADGDSYEGDYCPCREHSSSFSFEGYQFRTEDNFANGTYTKKDGTISKGEWKKCKLHGKAEFKTDLGILKGEFVEGVPNGFFNIELNNGQKASGILKNLEPIGDWELLFTDGCTYKGAIKDFVPHGIGTRTCPDGSSSSGTWQNGKIISKPINSDESAAVDSETLESTGSGAYFPKPVNFKIEYVDNRVLCCYCTDKYAEHTKGDPNARMMFIFPSKIEEAKLNYYRDEVLHHWYRNNVTEESARMEDGNRLAIFLAENGYAESYIPMFIPTLYTCQNMIDVMQGESSNPFASAVLGEIKVERAPSKTLKIPIYDNKKFCSYRCEDGCSRSSCPCLDE